SLNLYSYVRNVPTSRTDPSGHKVEYLPDNKNATEANKRVLSNVSKAERKLFRLNHDKKTGRYQLKLDTKAASSFKGEHTVGYDKLVTAVNSNKIAVVAIQSNIGEKGDDGTLRVYNVRSVFGGGTTTTGDKDISVVLSPDGNRNEPEHWHTQGPNGTKIPDSLGIIAGHELLGHGVSQITNGYSTEAGAQEVEKQLRKE